MFQCSFHILGDYTMIMQILPGLTLRSDWYFMSPGISWDRPEIAKKFRSRTGEFRHVMEKSQAETARREQRSLTSNNMPFQGQPRRSLRFYYIDNMHCVNEPNSDPFETQRGFSSFAKSCQLQVMDIPFFSHQPGLWQPQKCWPGEERWNWLLWGCQGQRTLWMVNTDQTAVFDYGK